MGLHEKRALYYSAGMHVALMLAIIFGLPDLFEAMRKPEPVAISVEILPISAVSNVKPSDKPVAKQKKAKQEKKPDPIKPQPKVKAEAKPKEEEKKEEPKPDPKPEVKEEPKPDPVKVPEKKEEEKPKKEEAKPKPKAEPEKKVKPKEVKEKPEDMDDLEAVLKDVKKQAQQKTDDVAQDDVSEESASKSSHYDASQPLSISQMDAVISQIQKNWIMPAGAKDDYTLVVTLRVVVAQDGTVQRVELAKDQGRYNADSFFRSAVESAIRAVQKSSPLKDLPADKYDTWKDMELTFNPKDLLF